MHRASTAPDTRIDFDRSFVTLRLAESPVGTCQFRVDPGAQRMARECSDLPAELLAVAQQQQRRDTLDPEPP